MSIKLTDLDISEYLDTEESIASYLNSIIDTGDPQLLLSAIRDVAKARGMSKIAVDSGLGRESLYKTLKPEAKPRFETILKVLKSLGVKIQFNAIDKNDEKKPKRIKLSKAIKKKGANKIQVSRNNRKRVKPIVKK